MCCGTSHVADGWRKLRVATGRQGACEYRDAASNSCPGWAMYRKPKGLPRVASPKAQAEFIAMYEQLLNGLGADEAVYFADAV